jgi:hypothetical protein
MNSHQRRKIKRHSSGPTATTTAIPQVHIPAIEGVLPKPPEKPPEKPPLRRTVSAGKAFLSTLLAVATLIGGWAVIKPSVHVAPYLRLDPKSSFSESFEITNLVAELPLTEKLLQGSQLRRVTISFSMTT